MYFKNNEILTITASLDLIRLMRLMGMQNRNEISQLSQHPMIDLTNLRRIFNFHFYVYRFSSSSWVENLSFTHLRASEILSSKVVGEISEIFIKLMPL